MANYQIYIKSTTLDQTGIHWRKAEDNERCEPPKLLLERCVPKEDGNMGTVNYMIDTNAPSLILVRHQNQLLIQVTGLYSEARSDQKGRKVFNTLVLQGEDNEDNEKLFCSLAISALDFISRHHNNLEQKIDESVQFDGKDKFKINVEKISSFIDRLKTKYGIQLSANRNSDYSIEKIEQGLKELQEMLTKNGLPKSWKPWKEEKEKEDGDGILIAVTKNLIDGGIFHKAGVWCGLANNVADPKEQKESTNEIHKESNPTCTENPKKPTKTNPNAIPILILILVVITVAIGLIWMRPQEPEEQPQILPIPQELIAPNGGKQTLIRPTKEINSKTFLSY